MLRTSFGILARRPLLGRGTLRPIPLLARGAANQVSGRPGSQTFEHAATNVKEEVKNTAAELAKRIAGGNYAEDIVKENSFAELTRNIAGQVPKPYLTMGLLGGIPYIGTAATTIYTAHQAGQAAMGLMPNTDPGVAHTILDQALSVQVTYGAVMLSFLGALHWGMEFAGMGGHKGYPRLILGVAPALFVWPTLMLAPTSALIAQWVGFTGLWWADSRVTGMGWTPKWYSQYRFYLSILVGTCIIGSLAGTSYWGPVAGHGLLSHDLDLIRDAKVQKENARTVGGEVEAVDGGEEGEHYVMIKHKQPEGGDDPKEGDDSEEGEAEGKEGGEGGDEAKKGKGSGDKEAKKGEEDEGDDKSDTKEGDGGDDKESDDAQAKEEEEDSDESEKKEDKPKDDKKGKDSKGKQEGNDKQESKGKKDEEKPKDQSKDKKPKSNSQK